MHAHYSHSRTSYQSCVPSPPADGAYSFTRNVYVHAEPRTCRNFAAGTRAPHISFPGSMHACIYIYACALLPFLSFGAKEMMKFPDRLMSLSIAERRLWLANFLGIGLREWTRERESDELWRWRSARAFVRMCGGDLIVRARGRTA